MVGVYAVGYAAGEGATGIAIDPSGNIWVTNYIGKTVTELSPSGNTLGIYSTNTTYSYPLWGNANPLGIAIDPSGNVWVVNTNNVGSSNLVTKLSPSGAAINYYLSGPVGGAIAIDPSGNIWVTGGCGGSPALGYSCVTKLSPSGSIGGSYTAGWEPDAIAIDPSGNIWTPSPSSGGPVTEISSSGKTIGSYNTYGGWPDAIAIDSSGNVWIANTNYNSVSGTYGAGTVVKLSPSGSELALCNVGSRPSGIAIDPQGNVWVANGYDLSVTELSPSCSTLGTYRISSGAYAIAIGTR